MSLSNGDGDPYLSEVTCEASSTMSPRVMDRAPLLSDDDVYGVKFPLVNFVCLLAYQLRKFLILFLIEVTTFNK